MRLKIESTMRSSSASWTDTVINYFEECTPEYQRIWGGETLALHAGYWSRQTRTHAESLLEMNRQMAVRCDIRRGSEILDAGCGLGGSSLWLAQHYDADVTGINITPGQVARAEGNARSRGLTGRVRFICRDFHDTGLPDECVDVVWAQEAVAHSEHKEAFFREAHRLLRPGGRLVMEEGLRVSRPYAAADERLLWRWLSGWAVPDLATGSEYVAWAQSAGFQDVRLDDVTANCRRSSRRLYLTSTLFYPLGLVRHPVRRFAATLRTGAGLIADESPLDIDVRFRNCRGGRYQWVALRRGLWFIGIMTGTKRVKR